MIHPVMPSVTLVHSEGAEKSFEIALARRMWGVMRVLKKPITVTLRHSERSEESLFCAVETPRLRSG